MRGRANAIDGFGSLMSSAMMGEDIMGTAPVRTVDSAYRQSSIVIREAVRRAPEKATVHGSGRGQQKSLFKLLCWGRSTSSSSNYNDNIQSV